MDKNLIIFGALGVFALVIVSAVLVGYLSNTVQTDIEVNSPMLQEVSYDSLTWSKGELVLDSVFGGESQTIYTKTTNQANAEITGTSENIVTNSAGVTCADFNSVLATTVTDGGTPNGPYDLIALGLCSVIDSNNIQFGYGPTPIVWQPNQVDETTIVVTFNQYASGTYKFTSQIV